ncbi:sensor histidine kinase [Pengzhenrongella frigida]|nr:sensor histidine kinase [Cellulomonas sp. HLT2-17]
MDPRTGTLPAGGRTAATGSARAGRPSRGDVAVTVGTLILMLVAVTERQGHQEFPGAPLLIFSVLAWLPLVVRTRWPLGVLVATVVVESLHLALVPFVAPDLETPIALAAYQPVPVATMVAAFTLATRTSRRTAWIAGGLAAVVLLGVSLVARPITLLATDIVMLLNLVVLATAIGTMVAGRRKRLAREARERVEHTRREVEGERLRIARELHDVLAHSLTLVNAQAAVADYLVRTDPQAAADALRGLTQHTRRALDELRATVGLLRQDGDAADGDPDAAGGLRPTPGLERLDELLSGFRAAGSDVRLAVTGEALDLPPRGDLAAYRIIQEALTNATKHAPGAPAAVTLDWGAGELQLSVANDRATGVPTGHRGPGTGHGLIGMRERALAAGGSVRAQPRADGGFLVSATIPAEAEPVPDVPSIERAAP